MSELIETGDLFLDCTFNLRVFHNANKPEFDWRLVRLPPGVRLSAGRQPGVERPGVAALYLSAGEVDRIAFTIQTMPGVTIPVGILAGNTRPRLAGETNGASYVEPVNLEIKELAAQATPPLAVEIGDPIIVLNHDSFYSAYFIDRNSSMTDGFLEDVEIHGRITLQYKPPDSFDP